MVFSIFLSCVYPVQIAKARNLYLPLWEQLPHGEPSVFHDPDGPATATATAAVDLTRPAVYTAAEGNIARLVTPNVRRWANSDINVLYSNGMTAGSLGDFTPRDENITRTGIMASFRNPQNGNADVQTLRITDGSMSGTNINTTWNTVGIGMGSDRTYVVINWGEPFEIYATRVEWHDVATAGQPIDPPDVARVEYHDGIEWREVKNMKNAAGQPVTDIPGARRTNWNGVTFDTVVTKMLRLSMARTGRRDNGYVGIGEWEVFGESAGGYLPVDKAKCDLDAITLPGTATENLTLPVNGGLFGSDINWASDNGSVISTTGVVTRPAFGNSDSTVKLTATAGVSGATDVRQFTIIVPALPSANSRALADLAAITIPSVTQSNLMLPTTGGEYGSNILWTSSDPEVVSTDGAVTPPPFSGTNATVTLTAEATNGGVTEIKSFTVKVDKMLISKTPETYANPINLTYSFQVQSSGNNINWHRDMADQQPIYFDGEYWLFPSFASGYFYSDNLVHWNYVHAPMMPGINRYAPGGFAMGGYVYVVRSNTGPVNIADSGGIWRTNTPHDPTSWVLVRNAGQGDPHFFYDEEEHRLFLVHGLVGTNDTATAPPDRILELNPDSPTLAVLPIDPNHPNYPNSNNNGYPIFWMARQIRGYEMPGHQNNIYTASTSSWLEGPGMFKADGKYYIYHAGPGTEWSSYAEGLWVSDDPLGPYEWVDTSPFNYKGGPNGFLTGAGHGHHVYIDGDPNKRIWKFGSPAISNNGGFERRTSLVPVDFSMDGTPVTDMSFSDYPMWIPTNPKAKPGDLGPGWQHLSLGATATASSTYNIRRVPSGSAVSRLNPFDIEPGKAFDENIRTWWAAETGDPGEWIQGDMGGIKTVKAIQVNFAEQDAGRFSANLIDTRTYTEPYRYLLEGSADGNNWFIIADKSNYEPKFIGDEYIHDYYELAGDVQMKYIKLTNMGRVPADGKFAVSGIRIFGNASQAAPPAVGDFTLTRVTGINNRTVKVNWAPAAGADGYMIRFGPSEDNLLHHRQVLTPNGEGLCEDQINMLTTHITNALNNGPQLGMDYYFRIDSFNGSGVTKGTKVIHLKQSSSRYRLDYSVVGAASGSTLTAKVDGNDIESFRTGNGGSMYLVEEGKNIVFTASSEYKVKEWKVNGVVYQQPAGTTYTGKTFTFDNVSGNVQVTIEYEGVIITSVANNGATAVTVTLAVAGTGTKIGEVFFAAYDSNGRMLMLSDKKDAAIGTNTYTWYDVNLPAGTKLKAFVWSETMLPLCEAKEGVYTLS